MTAGYTSEPWLLVFDIANDALSPTHRANGEAGQQKTKKDNKHLTKMKFIEDRNFLLNNINDFFLYNLNQGTLLRSIENRFSNE